MRIILVLLLFVATPALAQEGVLLNVNQTHTLSWQWESAGSPVRSFVFRCGQYVKHLEADARSLRFGSLIDEPGQYSGCTLAARNEAGLSAPVALPAFDYAYSYGALLRFILECAATMGAAASVLTISARSLLGYVRRRQQAQTVLTLPEPVITMVLEKERDYVYHHS